MTKSISYSDAGVSIVTVSSQSLFAPTPSPATDPAQVAEQLFAAELGDRSDAAPWTGASLWEAADVLSRSLHPGDRNERA